VTLPPGLRYRHRVRGVVTALCALVGGTACGRLGFDEELASGLGRFGGVGFEAGFALAATADGGVVIGGWAESAVTIGDVELPPAGGQDIVLVRLDAEGGVRWARRFGSSDYDNVRADAVDGDARWTATARSTSPAS
jgi:hypothetical protein